MIDFNLSYDFAFAVALQTDGKILVSGATGDDPFYDFGMLRLDTLGVLDTTFGTGGKVVTDFGTNEDWVNAMALQTDGKIILAGYKGYPSDIAMSRYNDDGSIDSTFGTAGKVISSLTTEDQANAICLQPDGKIVIGGMSAVLTNRDFSILRYNTNGLLDTTFSGNGYISTDFGTTSDKANAIALQADGKIVAAGVAGLDFAVARYLPSLTTGIIDFDNLSNSILIYPNPVLDEATLNYTLSKADIITINLVDVNGKLIKNFITNEFREATSHNQLLSFPSNLAHGTYFIVISNSTKQFSVQVVK
ncbi:MAG TPA: T9SS type A sorting domain-containing protein [Bacteroidia bacterium]|nr:T9SS type A sorting domain-containing protein [Bacteroidia bacterium]